MELAQTHQTENGSTPDTDLTQIPLTERTEDQLLSSGTAQDAAEHFHRAYAGQVPDAWQDFVETYYSHLVDYA